MAGSVNKVIIIGSLGRDPEIRTTQSGGKVANFTVATNESWRDKGSGERKEVVTWHRVSVLNERLAEVAEKYLRKGRKVYLEGAIQHRSYTDKAGQERQVSEIVISPYRGELTLLDSGREDTIEDVSRRPPAAARPAAPVERARATAAPAFAGRDDLDDEIPF